MNYVEKLVKTAGKSGNILCMGLDPVPEYLPGNGIISFFERIFNRMAAENIIPGAFKPNLGYFSSLDRPREGEFQGSMALSGVLNMLDDLFPEIPVILDSKRGDIARSSENYAAEGFVSWGCDAVTVSPYMGSDSVEPFLKEALRNSGGVYILVRTSNPGGADFQNIRVNGTDKSLSAYAAERVLEWAEKYPAAGVVAGATSLNELREILLGLKRGRVPVLIPGVGSQGGAMSDVMRIIGETGYDPSIVRVNVSSAVTHPWAKGGGCIPDNWEQVCIDSLHLFIESAEGIKQ